MGECIIEDWKGYIVTFDFKSTSSMCYGGLDSYGLKTEPDLWDFDYKLSNVQFWLGDNDETPIEHTDEMLRDFESSDVFYRWAMDAAKDEEERQYWSY